MTTTFDPAKTSATITLSGGNLTATKAVGAANYASALSTSGHGGTKVYAEVKVNNAGVDGGVGIATARPVDGDYVGGNASSMGVYSDGVIYLNGASVGTVTPTPVVGDWVGVAVDRSAQTISIRNVTQGGTFAGASISTLVGPLYIGISSYDGGALTANFDGTFAGAVPAGHARWDGTPLVPVFTTMPAAKGTLTLTRNDAVLKRTYVMPAAKGTLVLTGIAAATRRNVPLVAVTRAFVLTGNAANLIAAVARRLIADTGMLVLTGNAANLTKTTAYRLVADAGAVVLLGVDVALRAARKLLADVGALLLTGNPADLVHVAAGLDRVLVAGTGSLVLTGNPVTLRIDRAPARYEPVSFASLMNKTVHLGILRQRKF